MANKTYTVMKDGEELKELKTLAAAKKLADAEDAEVFCEGLCVYQGTAKDSEDTVSELSDAVAESPAKGPVTPVKYTLTAKMNIRKAPTKTAEIAGIAEKGTVVEVASIEGDWLHLSNGTFILYVDDLKQIGVNVFFEKEQIDTATASGEMLLTILSAFAQEESRNISENLKWGLRKRYEMGQGRWSALYGFRLDEKGEAVIEPGEGEIVWSIFDLYREGTTLPKIVTKLNDLKITSPRGKKWTESTVLGILRNERYAGDMILQKWISTDFKTHKCIPNDGKEVPTYRIENSHVPIIDKRTFKQVQRILELRAPRGEITRYPYVDSKIICPYCGKSLIPRQMHVQQKKKAMCCFGEDGCHGFSVKTWMLDEVLRAAFEEVDPEDVKGNGDAAKRMREAQRIGTPATIEYWFLDDLVKEVTFSCTNGTRLQKHKKGPATTEKTYDWEVTVHWQCGLSTTVPLPMDKNQTEEPTHVAELYETYLNRVDSGEYIPARPKSIFEKQLVAQKRVTKIGGKDDHKKD